jgi:hypothetical protein
MRRNNTIKRGIFFDENVEDLDNELLDFDPLGDLQACVKGCDDGLDAAQRKSVWKMNSLMKCEHQAKAQKDMLINDHLLKKIKEICVTNVADIRVAQT